ncbi:MAG: EscU/YscU/HrcU family type III secretion system export apparatus switch protein [Myxococcaceae bacterium]|nr:EscU/YscU/HrcU family type III secretion system export apparatus switch protein [Myxococcaceae bacterium]
MSSKTEQPTPHRKAEAAKKGQYPRSAWLNAAVSYAGAWLALSAAWQGWSARFEPWCAQLWLLTNVPLGTALKEGTEHFARLALTVGLSATVPVVIVGLFTTRGAFDPAHTLPKIENLQPGKAFTQLASAKHWLTLAKGVLLAVIVLAWAWSNGAEIAQRSTVPLPLPTLLPLAWGGFIDALEALLVLILVLGALDYMLELRAHQQSLMMTREEVKREHRDSEGDPRLKSQRQSRHRQMMAGGGKQGVRNANVVVVNPTHIAVALRYVESECDAPYLVAKGRDEQALDIRAEATQHHISIVRDVPLARSLIHFDLGEEIPEELYQAAAVVLKVAAETAAQERTPP